MSFLHINDLIDSRISLMQSLFVYSDRYRDLMKQLKEKIKILEQRTNNDPS
jgi:hypothetical protein